MRFFGNGGFDGGFDLEDFILFEMLLDEEEERDRHDALDGFDEDGLDDLDDFEDF